MEVNSYDQVEYPCYPFSQTHPDRIATIAKLHGMNPAPIEQCRVLELGCGTGANFYPMAEAFPNSEFVGIDLATPPIEEGQRAVAELNFKNLHLHRADIMQVNESLGKFDYIIAHGVYSWVPQPVREQLLKVCRQHLNEQGIAYISYNAYPGHYLRQMPRDMMRMHTRSINEPMEKVTQGLALLQLILKRFENTENAKADLFGHLITNNLEELEGFRHREGIYHDILAEENTAFYFYQFAGQAAQQGLQYLSEADFCETNPVYFPEEVQAVLNQFGDENLILKEQYMDYLKCRIFRQTLICPTEVKLDRKPKPQLIKEFFISAPGLKNLGEINLAVGVIEEFKVSERTKLRTDFPAAKAVLVELATIRPRTVGFAELILRASRRLHPDKVFSEEEQNIICEVLYSAYCADVIELRTVDLKIAAEIGSHPKTTVLARWQAVRQDVISNLLHASVDIEAPLTLRLLQLMDGQHDTAQLLEKLLTTPEAEALKKEDGTPFSCAAELSKHLEKSLPESLESLRENSLIVA